ncbi:hypothetical protein SprV_0100360000 [Sparganum proliferum]
MFGAPSTVTTTRSAQFRSALFQTSLKFFGCTRIRTTAYHPAANGMVERFHRQLKTVLGAAGDPGNWSDNLLHALLGIRADLKSIWTVAQLNCFSALSSDCQARWSPQPLVVHRLNQFMRSPSPVPPRTPTTESCVEKGLDNCIYVFVRCDRVRQPLEPLYEGPFRVPARNTKTCRILRGDGDVVSVDRVKAAFAEEPPDLPQGQDCADPLPRNPPPPLPHAPPPSQPSLVPLSPTASDPCSSNATGIRIARSGRRVYFLDRVITQV